MNAYAQIPNISLLPEEYRRPLISILQLCLILVILAALSGAYFAFHGKSSQEAGMAGLEAEISRLETEIETSAATGEQAREISREIDEAGQDLDRARESREYISSEQVSWSKPVLLLFNSLPSGVMLSSVTQDGLKVSIRGTSPDTESLFLYHDCLLNSSETEDVFIQSLSRQKKEEKIITEETVGGEIVEVETTVTSISYPFTLLVKFRE